MCGQECVLERHDGMWLLEARVPLCGRVVWQATGIQCSDTEEQPVSVEILNHQSQCPAQGMYTEGH